MPARSDPTTVEARSWPERAAPWVAAVASVWFALAAAWGMFGPIVAGHYGTMGGEGIIGENMVRWHIFGPVWDYVTTPPTPNQYYCHHPWGGFWMMGLLIGIFGHQDFVLPLPAVLMSAATPPLLYGIARDAWGKVAGAAAAVGFVFLPITLAFANFHNVEVTVLFGCALFFWGHGRMLKTSKVRHLVASLAGAAIAASGDWPAYVMLGAFLGLSLVRLVAPHVVAAPGSFKRFAAWWALAVSISVGALVLWVALFARSDKLGDWLTSASTRGSGETATLSDALAARKQWIEISFTPFVIFLGKLAAPIALIRLFWRRTTEEAYSLSILAGATVSYVFFKQAADVHIFWSHYFGGYFALALAQLVATLGDVSRKAMDRLKPGQSSIVAGAVPLGATVLFALLLAPDAMRTLRYARETGGRFNEHGHTLNSETDIIYLLKILKNRVKEGIPVEVMSPHIAWSWAYGWAFAGPGAASSSIPTTHADGFDPRPLFLARASGLTVEQQKALVSNFRVEIYNDDLWLVDRRAPAGPLEAYALEEREPNLWEWYFVSGVEPMRRYQRDPFATWEWRTHFGQSVDFSLASSPVPTTSEQIRAAHNMAVAAEDAGQAAALKARLESRLSRESSAPFSQGIALLGHERIGGTEPRIRLFFQANEGATPGAASFAVRAMVESKKRSSLIPADTAPRDVSMPPAMSTRLYRAGFIYSQTVVLRQRIGVERFYGSFDSRDGSAPPMRLDGRPETPLILAR